MFYNKRKKALADSRRYGLHKKEISIQRKKQRQANKPIVRTGNPTLEILRECIKQGYCWWCGRGGWQRLAQHTAMVHHIYANDIREMAFMLKNKPTCIKEESEHLSASRRAAMKAGRAKAPDWHLAQGIQHEWSAAGLERQRELQKHMIEYLNPESYKKISAKTSRPHACPVCGKMIPHSKPLCCSFECRQVRQEVGLKVGRSLYFTSAEHKFKMTELLNKVRQKPKIHKCVVCGKTIFKSRPRKYCSSECAHNPFNLPVDEIKVSYLNGESSTNLAKIYRCCDHTIRRHLRTASVQIRCRARRQ